MFYYVFLISNLKCDVKLLKLLVFIVFTFFPFLLQVFAVLLILFIFRLLVIIWQIILLLYCFISQLKATDFNSIFLKTTPQLFLKVIRAIFQFQFLEQHWFLFITLIVFKTNLHQGSSNFLQNWLYHWNYQIEFFNPPQEGFHSKGVYSLNPWSIHEQTAQDSVFPPRLAMGNLTRQAGAIDLRRSWASFNLSSGPGHLPQNCDCGSEHTNKD